MVLAWPFKKRAKSFLGIDIGTAEIRIVELSRYGDQEKLENYGSLSLAPFYSISPTIVKKGGLLFSSKRLAELVASILAEAKMETKKACFSIPDFSTLFTTFTLPPMGEEEISQAVKFEARRHVPLPLSEVTLDWLITKGKPSSERKEELEILLVVVPNRIIDQYNEIAELCGLELKALEAEVFSLERALVKNQKGVFCLVDIGARSTTCSIIDNQTLRLSYSFDTAGNDLTERLAKTFGFDYEKAEVLKKNQGLLEGEKDLSATLKPLLSAMASEISRVVQNFYEREGKEVNTYIIAGSSASLPGLKEYFAQYFKKEINIAFPFSGMLYPSLLERELKKIGPSFAIATGVALKGLE